MHNKLIGIVGMGYLGKGIAACFLAHGKRVIVHSQGADWRNETQSHIASSLDELSRRGGIEPTLHSTWRSRYAETASIADLYRCNFVGFSNYAPEEATEWQRRLVENAWRLSRPEIPGVSKCD